MQISKDPLKLSENCLICLGAKIPSFFVEKVAKAPRPALENIRWTEMRNLFVSFQRFYKPKSGLDLKDLIIKLRDKILYKYFPVLVEPQELALYYVDNRPVSCEWNLDYKMIKEPTANVIQAKKDLSNDLKAILKDTYQLYQTTENQPHISMARIQKPEEFDPDETKSLDYVLPFDRFYIENLIIAEISKDEFGLKYSFHNI